MADRCVVRNAAYKRGSLSIRQRRNERQNADYMNDDIIKDRAAYNVHFKKCEGSYEQVFDKMLADKTISTKGLGKDPNIVDELVFDVNTAYFENHGGYEYAKSFFEEAYRCSIEEVGGSECRFITKHTAQYGYTRNNQHRDTRYTRKHLVVSCSICMDCWYSGYCPILYRYAFSLS